MLSVIVVLVLAVIVFVNTNQEHLRQDFWVAPLISRSLLPFPGSRVHARVRRHTASRLPGQAEGAGDPPPPQGHAAPGLHRERGALLRKSMNEASTLCLFTLGDFRQIRIV